ncbi:cold-shock protein [Paludibacter jiangxiensis]|uniref:cold-shock protein n=1 Tax=Paludibacter jiangxiensis TaxID=681398 RepID=UPI003F7687AC
MSVNKKELEKKKEQKKREKLKRKEERKASGGSKSFEDMIAYVDEFGMITDTPPDPTKKTEVELESIAVSSPKKEDIEKEPLRGRVEHFNTDKGYGFIKDMGSVNKYFFHISNAPENISEGNIVTFELEKGQKGMNAVRIELSK